MLYVGIVALSRQTRSCAIYFGFCRYEFLYDKKNYVLGRKEERMQTRLHSCCDAQMYFVQFVFFFMCIVQLNSFEKYPIYIFERKRESSLEKNSLVPDYFEDTSCKLELVRLCAHRVYCCAVYI